MRKLPRSFYNRETTAVARELLGKYLIHVDRGVERIGRIVETEAYLGTQDLAAHSSKGLTDRTKVMFGPPGYAYVYMIYGMHHCMNVVTEAEGNACAVLIRALEPVRNLLSSSRGPGLVCRALNINLTLNAWDLISDNFYIAAAPKADHFTIIKRPRIGVEYARHWAKRHLRFFIGGNPFVSRR